jgi:hypothetical protein
LKQLGYPPAALEWAKKLTEKDMAVIDGSAHYNRVAPEDEVRKLKILRGHLKQGQFVTKIRKVFTKREMDSDLEFIRATFDGVNDDMEYFAMLPTSPP